VQNYFNYFTEIEERYQRRRGTGLLLSTLDWALIETWKDAGLPLEAVLRGIDETFDKYDRRPVKAKKINSLAYCAQEVLAAAEDMKEAAVGSEREGTKADTGLNAAEIAQFMRKNADKLRQVQSPAQVRATAEEVAAALSALASEVENATTLPRLEDLERRLTVLEEKLQAALTVVAPEEELVALRAEADREIAPYRSKMPAAQIVQLQKQFTHRRMLEKATMPRLSLFYM
jgi:hypothetical protein